MRYAHFQGNNPPWPTYFGSTSCNFIDWSVDVSILNTIDPYCTTLSITTLSNCLCVIVLLYDVLPAHFSYISVWCMKSTSKTHVVVNGGCCGYMASWPVLPAPQWYNYAYRSILCNMVLVSFPTSQSYPPWQCSMSSPASFVFEIVDIRPLKASCLRNGLECGLAGGASLMVSGVKDRRVSKLVSTNSKCIVT